MSGAAGAAFEVASEVDVGTAGEKLGRPLVAKMSVGASGKSVTLIEDPFNLQGDDVSAMTLLVSQANDRQRILLQEFIPEIKTAGEMSVIYIAGKYVGAYIKNTAKDSNEFRINSAFGGSSTRLDDNQVPSVAKNTGQKVLEWLAGRFGKDACAYLRMDGIFRDDGSFVLMGKL